MMEKSELELISTKLNTLQSDIAEVHLHPEKVGITKDVVLKDGGKDYFTAVDEYVEKFAVESLKSILPGSGFIGEETGESGPNSNYLWLIDPIDGTAVYKMGGDYYSSSIALIDKAGLEVVLGSVFQSARGRQFVRLPHELYVNEPSFTPELGKPYQVKRRPLPSDSSCFGEWLGCSFGTSKYYDRSPGIKERLEKVFSETEVPELKRRYAAKDARPASGSSNLFCCDIADGNRHFALLFFQKPWDLAVGALYARDAGCLVVMFDDSGSIISGDLEQRIVHATKDSLINVGVFANNYVQDYILGKFNAGI